MVSSRISRIDDRLEISALIGSLIILVITLLPILQTPFFGDDVPNSQRSAVLIWTNQSMWESITSSTHSWMVNEGRFFPVAVIENTLLFNFVHSRWIYKVIQLSSTVLVGCLLAYLIFLITRTLRPATLSLLIFGAVLQIRNWYDPTIGFGLLLQSVTIKVLITAICLLLGIRTTSPIKSGFILFLAFLNWTAALLQYEIVLFVLPGLLLLIFLDGKKQFKKKIIASSIILVPTISILSYVYYLRIDVTPSSAYTVNADLRIASSTFIKQLSGLAPFSSAFFLGGTHDLVALFSNWRVCSLIILLTVVFSSTKVFSKISFSQNLRGLLLFGLVLATMPAITTSLSVRWQQEISWGLPYLSIFVQYVGATIVGVCSIEFLFKKVQLFEPFSKFLVNFPLTFIVLVAAFFNLMNTKSVSDEISSLRTSRELYEQSIRAELMNQVSNDAVIFSPQYDNNSWTNPFYTSWLGGPNASSFVLPNKNLLDSCRELSESCELSRQWIGLTTISSIPNKEVIAIGELAKTNTEFSKTQLQTGSIKVATRKVVSLPSLCRKDIQIRKNVVFATCSKSINNFSEIKD